jgi:hypothetical protein
MPVYCGNRTMPGIKSAIAFRRAHRFSRTKPWIVLNSLLSAAFDTLDICKFFCGRCFIPPQLATEAALYEFKRIIRRHLADIQVYDRLACSENFRSTLLQLSAITGARMLYRYCTNSFNLRYLDFLYFQAAMCVEELGNERPLLEIIWTDDGLFKEMCSSTKSCIIVVLHIGFAHTARAISMSEKKMAYVGGVPDQLLALFQANKVRNPEAIEIVPVNRYTLLTLSRIAKENKAIISSPDVINPRTGNCDYLSLGMFKLSEYTGAPLYFFDYALDKTGSLRGFIKGPVEAKAGAEKAAEDFLEFCGAISGRQLTIMRKQASVGADFVFGDLSRRVLGT